jgi:integrase
MKLGDAEIVSVADARKQAKALLGEVARGGDPLMEKRQEASRKADALEHIALEYLDREAKRGLRSIDQSRAVLKRLILPSLGALPVSDIRKTDIVRLLDRINDEHGPAMARQTFATLRRLLSWHESRSDDFLSPIRRGMAKDLVAAPKDRERILNDDELRALWRATETHRSPCHSLVQFLLLTGCRRSEALGMTWRELVNGDWLLPASRNKTKVELVRPLSRAAKAVLNDLPRIGDFVFTLIGRSPIGAVSAFKRTLEEASGVTNRWTLHDLRRTARSLMSRAGVPVDHAERCLGHVIAGVRGTYDRHQYQAEMLRAYEMLAAQIERIVNQQENVVLLRGAEISA